LKDKDKDGKEIVIPETLGYQLIVAAVLQGNSVAKILF
jgi:hypothetical protein